MSDKGWAIKDMECNRQQLLVEKCSVWGDIVGNYGADTIHFHTMKIFGKNAMIFPKMFYQCE